MGIISYTNTNNYYIYVRYTCFSYTTVGFLLIQGSVYAPSFDHGVGDPIEDDIHINLQ